MLKVKQRYLLYKQYDMQHMEYSLSKCLAIDHFETIPATRSIAVCNLVVMFLTVCAKTSPLLPFLFDYFSCDVRYGGMTNTLIILHFQIMKLRAVHVILITLLNILHFPGMKCVLECAVASLRQIPFPRLMI